MVTVAVSRGKRTATTVLRIRRVRHTLRVPFRADDPIREEVQLGRPSPFATGSQPPGLGVGHGLRVGHGVGGGVLAACGPTVARGITVPAPTTTEATTSSSAPSLPIGVATSGRPEVPGAGACHARGVLPDATCTPGATNPAVTQADVGATICTSGWTTRIRPPEAYTDDLKAAQMTAYGDHDAISAYEEDHVVPLELGGAPTDPRNLWPEHGRSPNPKDRVESAGRRAGCDGRIPLAAAQTAIASNWRRSASKWGSATWRPRLPRGKYPTRR